MPSLGVRFGLGGNYGKPGASTPPPSGGFILLSDSVSIVLLADGTSKLQKAALNSNAPTFYILGF